MEDAGLSIPSERLIGFTVPDKNRFLVCDHDEVWEVVVDSTVVVEETDHAPYTVAERADFVGWGREHELPVLEFGRTKIAYDFDPKAPVLHLRYTQDGKEGQIDFPILSGDWFSASLSRNGKLLVLAEPYKISLYRTAV